MPKVTTRKERRKEQRQHYLAGEARRPYTQTPALNDSLEEDRQVPAPGTGTGSGRLSCCAKCQPALERYVGIFKGMVHQGSARKRRKRLNPRPKRPNAIPYRDLKHQNEWLRENLFDSKGNYLFCRSCICATFEVSPGRLARQRTIKRKQSTDPLKDMSKAEVEDQRLGDYVVMPTAVDSSFKAWWRSLQPSHIVSIRYPHARHGNAGQTAHSAKTSVMESFLQFVDVNSQPNGRSEDSTGPTFYFLPKFTTIQKLKAGISHFRERLTRSLVGEFNRAQRETGGRGDLKRHVP